MLCIRGEENTARPSERIGIEKVVAIFGQSCPSVTRIISEARFVLSRICFASFLVSFLTILRISSNLGLFMSENAFKVIESGGS